MKKIPNRQVHLDFHTSEMIDQVGSKFSADVSFRINQG